MLERVTANSDVAAFVCICCIKVAIRLFSKNGKTKVLRKLGERDRFGASPVRSPARCLRGSPRTLRHRGDHGTQRRAGKPSQVVKAFAKAKATAMCFPFPSRHFLVSVSHVARMGTMRATRRRIAAKITARATSQQMHGETSP